jgi:hypothetical protein
MVRKQKGELNWPRCSYFCECKCLSLTQVHSTDAAVNQTAAPSSQASLEHLEGLIIEGNGDRKEQKVSGVDGDVSFLQLTIYLTTTSNPIASIDGELQELQAR